MALTVFSQPPVNVGLVATRHCLLLALVCQSQAVSVHINGCSRKLESEIVSQCNLGEVWARMGFGVPADRITIAQLLA